MKQEPELLNKIIMRLLIGEAIPTEEGESLGKSESEITPALDRLRGDDTIECMAGLWGLTGSFKVKVAAHGK